VSDHAFERKEAPMSDDDIRRIARDVPPFGAALTRRRVLGLLGTAGLGAVAAACGGGGSSSAGSANRSTSSSRASGNGTATTSGTSGANGTGATTSCVLTPEVTEGPYYINADLVRSNVTEGKPGTPLELAITVLDADTCAPVRDAAVDIWHCDAEGIYSGFQAASTGGPGGGGGPGDGPGGGGGATDATRYLRGTQVTGADGVATFQTIYPGWYQGRAVHIHMKVHVNSSTRHTGQLFFDDKLNDTVYEAAPYSSKGSPDMRNADDSIFQDAGAASAIVDMTPSGNGYRGTIAVGINQAA
jgi:protocatechuate 3,4-dioxygenase beta subunit